MSLQNLLEMDSFSQPSSLNEREAERPKPKPRSRTRVLKMVSSPNKNERDVDDVMSISSRSSVEKRDLLHLSKPSERKSKTRTSTTAFENDAYINDEDQVSEASGKRNRAFISSSRPQNLPTGRKASDLNSPSSNKYQKKVSSSKQRQLHLGSSQEDESEGEREHKPKPISEDDDDDSRSDVTYTVENEKQKQDNQDVPKPRMRQTSRIPKPKSSLESHQQQGEPKNEKESKRNKSSKNEDSQNSYNKNSITKDEYLAVQIEPEIEGEENSKKSLHQDESETVSITSTTKDTVKSRFGKLFGSASSASENKTKKKNTGLSIDKESDGGAAVKERSSFVNRWKQTFSKGPASSKAAEENEKVNETIIEEKEAKYDEDTNVQKRKTSSKAEKMEKKEKSDDTRIFIPEVNSEGEANEVSVNSYSATDNEPEQEDSPKRKRNDRKEGSKQKLNKKEVKLDEEVKYNEENEGPDGKNTMGKLRPLAKIWRSKSKGKEKNLGQSKEVEKAGYSLKKEEKMEKSEDPKVLKKERKEKSAKENKKKSTQHSKRIPPRARETTDFSDLSVSEEDSTSKSESESEVEKKVRRKEKKSSMSHKKQKVRAQETILLKDSASGKDFLFGITIHQSDLLPLDPNVIHPVVKVTVIYQNGKFMRKSSDQKSPTRRDEKMLKKKKSKASKGEDILYSENIAESVLPIMTQPCHARHSIPTFAPTWNELLVFEEPFKRFAVPNEDQDSEMEPILFFEIMDFLPMSTNGHSTSVTGFHGSDTGWYKAAWAFLKPIGANGVMNLNRKIRLQLYRPVKVRGKEKFSGPEVFSWWKSGKREKINCTLFVTPKAIIPPETRTASLRQLLSMRKEQLTQAILDSQLATKTKKKRSLQQSLTDLRNQMNWSRMEGQSCKPPNKLVAALPTSQIESLNIVISGNVHCVKFSPCGRKLAAGLDTDELHVVLIFEVPSWTLLRSLKGHHGIIYEITWKIYELNDDTSQHYLASASADSTVRIWKMENSNENTMVLTKVLYHPSYVYCVKFHPTHPSIVATGCFDCILRIWDFKPDHSDPIERKTKKHSRKENMTNSEVSPNILLDKHSSFVNCLLFDHSGKHLFSGDGSACIFKWNCTSPSQKKLWKLERDAKLHPEDIPVNSIDLHPSGNRILVQLRDNFIKVLDVVTFIPLQTFSGLSNERFQISSCFSPCGNLVLSGSEDSTLCIWDADTGKILQFVCPRNHPHCIVSCVDYHPYDYYISIGVASAISEPSPVLVYFYNQPARMNYPLLKKSAMKMRQSLEKSRSQSTDSINNNTDGSMGTRKSRSGAPFPAKRGDSSEKFISIIQKLDTALYLAQQRNKRRLDETHASTCASNSGEKAQHSSKLPGQENQAKNDIQKIQQESKRLDENLVEMSSSSVLHYVKNQLRDRPRSASSATKEKRERFRKSYGEEERYIKSDSEQMHELKLKSSLAKKSKVSTLTTSMSTRKNSLSQEESPMNNEEQEEVLTRPKPLKRRLKTFDDNANRENNDDDTPDTGLQY